MIEKRPFRRGSGPYTLDYRGWDQDRVVVLRLRLDSHGPHDAAAVAAAFNTWLSESTFPMDDAPHASKQGAPSSGEAGEPRERACGGCRLTWFFHGDSITVSLCSGGEDGLDSTYWCSQEIVEAARSAAGGVQVSWQEWRGRQFGQLEEIYFRAPGS